MNDHRTLVLAGCLGLVWAVLLALRLLDHTEPQRVPLTYKSGMTAAPDSARGDGLFGTIVQPLPGGARQMSFTTPKNIFATLDDQAEAARRKLALARPKPVEPPKPPDPPPVVATAPPPPPPPPPPSPEELARQKARQMMAQYRFLGYLTQGGQLRAFLGKGREIFIVGMGEAVEGGITVAAIDATSIKLREINTNFESTLLLVKEGGGNPKL